MYLYMYNVWAYIDLENRFFGPVAIHVAGVLKEKNGSGG